jgi:hypothetical protein
VTMQDAGAGFDNEAGHRRGDGTGRGGEVNRRGEVLSAQCSVLSAQCPEPGAT